MKDEAQRARSMLDHAAMENRITRDIFLRRFECDPVQVARGVAKYHLGIFHYAQTLHKLIGHEFDRDDLTEDRKRMIAHIMAEIRTWHLANFGIEPPWVQAIERAKKERL